MRENNDTSSGARGQRGKRQRKRDIGLSLADFVAEDDTGNMIALQTDPESTRARILIPQLMALVGRVRRR
jgi:hypothetical protein